MPLLWLIASAYDVSIRQVSGLPSSFSSRNYDIEAKSARQASRKQMMRMLQTLVEDRFKLRLRHETKDLSVYVLMVAKGGPKLDENKNGEDMEAGNSGAGREFYRNYSMPIFANILSAHLDDTVVDKTGLIGVTISSWSLRRSAWARAGKMGMSQRRISTGRPFSRPCGSNLD